MLTKVRSSGVSYKKEDVLKILEVYKSLRRHTYLSPGDPHAHTLDTQVYIGIPTNDKRFSKHGVSVKELGETIMESLKR